jgi:rhodanese-related sulfurtransferase
MSLELGRTDCTMEEVKQELASLGPKDLLLDVRTPEEYAEGHIAGSRNIDHEEVAHYAAELKAYDRVIVYCRSGKRSQVAYHSLAQMGLKNLVCVSGGGMMTWIERGYPVRVIS